jgi:hypothetical protein
MALMRLKTGRAVVGVTWVISLGLTITTALSTVLVVATSQGWTISGSLYDDIVTNRTTYQLVIQLVSTLLGLIYTSILCRLVNNAARLRLAGGSAVRMSSLRAWAAMSIPNFEFGVPIRYMLPLLVVSTFGIISSALWVGALTPSASIVQQQHGLVIPSYRNTSLIKEYPSEIKGTGPTITTKDGLFSYSVGIKFLGSLVASAASATTADGSVRKHAKLDNTQFSFSGRSYGVGSPVGLTDASVRNLPLAGRYTYQEQGYLASISCIYNSSTDFKIGEETVPRTYPVSGNLPDSVEGPEFSEYIGHTPDTIVAIGVAFSTRSPRRYMAIAASDSYAELNTIQCALDFTPTMFNVTVGIASRNISVQPAGQIADFDLERNLTRTVVRQFELIANDMTNLYVSIVGDALMSSVTALRASIASPKRMDSSTTLRGVENAITAVTDDMLAAYASAQLMVGNLSQVATADVSISTLTVGQRPYIIAIAVINLVVLLVVIEELIRTKVWHGLPSFNLADPTSLVAASFMGGKRCESRPYLQREKESDRTVQPELSENRSQDRPGLDDPFLELQQDYDENGKRIVALVIPNSSMYTQRI